MAFRADVGIDNLVVRDQPWVGIRLTARQRPFRSEAAWVRTSAQDGPACHTRSVPVPRSTAQARSAPVGAVIDIGAYSVHLLIAEVHGHSLVPIVDESIALGLGATVDARGELGAEAALELIDALEAYHGLARRNGASTLAIVATDPLRRAADSAAVVAAIGRRIAIEIQVLRPEEEALLALLGVHAGKPIRRETVLVDVGGGSSEILVIGPSGDPVIEGMALGAARLSQANIAGAAPTAREMDAMLSTARTILARAPDGLPVDLVAVGGTASNLLRIGPPLARRVLFTRRLRDTLALLVDRTPEEIAARYGVKLSRARVLPGGASILLAVAERYGRDHLRISEHGLREGLMLASVHAGPGWRADLAWLAHGWSR